MPGACALFSALGVIVWCIFLGLEWFSHNGPPCVTICVCVRAGAKSLLVDV